MTYNDVIKKLESIGIEIDYTRINLEELNVLCGDANHFENQIRTKK